MFGIGMPELIVILVIALLVFGTKSLPEIGSGLGKAIRGFKEATDEGSAAPPSQARLDTRVCPRWGTGRPSDAAFCPRCGAKFQAS